MDHYSIAFKTEILDKKGYGIEKAINAALQDSVSSGTFETRGGLGDMMRGVAGITDNYYELANDGVVRVSKVHMLTCFAMEVYLLGFSPESRTYKEWQARLTALGFKKNELANSEELMAHLLKLAEKREEEKKKQ